MKSNLDRIREGLSKALASPEIDIDAVLQLSSELAKQDPDNVRFSADAAIISRLGRELVAKQETAVAELVKNAYDADALEVTLTFENATQKGGVLIIEDNGVGMTRDQLIGGFMRLSSADKIENPFSTIYGRRRAGRKGIGRFAVQRLGGSLIIVTQTSDNEQALQVEVDWSIFTSGRDLSSIANRISTVPKNKQNGTTLTINSLEEAWSEAAIRRVYRYVSELLQPFPLRTLTVLNKSLKKKDGQEVDPGFKVELWQAEGDKLELIADEEQSIFNHALAEVEGYVDENGKGFWTVKSKKYQLREEVFPIGKDREFPIPFSYLRNISLKAYYFIWQSSLVPRSMYATLRTLAQEKAGIRIYRNGFRVPPYGEPQDDWLGLDASTRARDILPPHANTNYFGFAEVIDPEGYRFDETSSREGLRENDAFKELQSFCTRVLKATALQVAEARGRKQTSSQKNWNKGNGNPDDAVKAAAEKLAAAAAAERERKRKAEEAKQEELNRKNTSNSDDKPKQEDIEKADEQENNQTDDTTEEDTFTSIVAETAAELLAANAEQRQRNEELLAELGMLRVLASLGLTIGEFTHEVRQTLDAALLDAQSLAGSLPVSAPESNKAVRLKNNIERFTTYASYFDQSIRDNVNRELTTHNLRASVNRFFDTVNPSAIQADITLSKKITGYDLFTPPMHSSELASLLFNFYSNSKKAIHRANVSGKIQISVSAENNKIYLEFSDNGDGIPEKNQDKIFDAFFTTSTPSGIDASEEEELQGTGLGLKIVKDIVEAYNGEISIIEPPTGFTTCIRVEFPLHNIEEDDG